MRICSGEACVNSSITAGGMLLLFGVGVTTGCRGASLCKVFEVDKGDVCVCSVVLCAVVPVVC